LAAEGVPGDFDFYVFALSWSPTYCQIEENPHTGECSGEPNGFVVHGLWPQYEKGYPEYCRNTGNRWVSDAIVESVSDIMPSAGLVGSEWRKHGICSGLDQSDYFGLVRKAYSKITIPAAFGAPTRNQTLAPGSVETAFIDANPGMTSGGIAVTCKDNALFEVKICLTRGIDFRTCQEVNNDDCPASRISVPGVE
jgi:ribonuclease T2